MRIDILSLMTSSLSHELITPLKCTISLCNKIIKSREITPVGKKKLKYIVNSTKIALC